MESPPLDYESFPRRRTSNYRLFLWIFLILLAIGGSFIAGVHFLVDQAEADFDESKAVYRIKLDLSNVGSSLDAFKNDTGRYPTTAEGLNALAQNPSITGWKGPYINKIPMDWWGHPISYRRPGTGGKPYDLINIGPDGIVGTTDDISN